MTPPPQPCGQCSNGQRLVTVNQVGADGTPFQSVRHETCTACHGTGQRS